ncbi:hypothetical protein GSQ54_03940 [Clostridioides difficile]|nr:hypothetical protein [Clostridioides sp. ZZV14-6387]MCI9977958.1 hypothetical protein [Clostridioides difficile]NJI79591.1 hypothetical protein [Clostridioides difficile]NJJ34167.1 hypothetical protein [Clostridioides difficile]NJK12522.1 hypothetical protein [Clostridioides difficile]
MNDKQTKQIEGGL